MADCWSLADVTKVTADEGNILDEKATFTYDVSVWMLPKLPHWICLDLLHGVINAISWVIQDSWPRCTNCTEVGEESGRKLSAAELMQGLRWKQEEQVKKDI